MPFDRLGREQGNVEGTGLGLSLSKALVEAMGGSISASRNSGPGTTFKVALEACPAYGATRGEPHSAFADVGRRHPQILFIEDSLASIGLIEEILQLRPSIGVLTAMQAGIGLQLARHHQPGLIILDAYLPDLTGAETARRLAEDPRTRDIPVIMASTEAKPRRGTSSLKNRSRTHLTKPIESRELLAAIDDLFGPGREFGLPGKGED